MQAVGSDRSLVAVNLVVLFHWVATWTVSRLVPSEFVKPILDSMHQGMFVFLNDSGLDQNTSQCFVHERYAEYRDALSTRKGGEVLHHWAACFVGFCNPKDDGQVFYSLDFRKITPVALHIGAFASAFPKALVQLIKIHAA